MQIIKQTFTNKKTTWQSTTRQRFVFGLATLLMVSATAVSMLSPLTTQAQSVNELQNKSQQLQAEINETNRRAHELEEQAASLKNTIAGMDINIELASKEIERTEVEVKRIELELVRTQAELDRQKELLRASMRALYMKGGASTVELIVASDSFSEFINDQEYLERLKTAIQDSTNKVIVLKQQLTTQQEEQKELLAKQQASKRALDAARTERAQLLAVTEGEEARFREHVASLQAKRRAVEDEITKMLLAKSFVSLGRVQAGQVIGRVGMTGMTTGPHLHFELRSSANEPLDPNWGGGTSLGRGLLWPIPSGGYLSQDYGCQSNIVYARPCGSGSWLHAGLDIVSPVGTQIVAAKSGNIIFRGNHGDGYGIKVIVQHDDGTLSYYAHMNP